MSIVQKYHAASLHTDCKSHTLANMAQATYFPAPKVYIFLSNNPCFKSAMVHENNATILILMYCHSDVWVVMLLVIVEMYNISHIS